MTAAPTQGAAMVTVTDDPGDFLSYIVNVTSLQLTRSDGTVVETVSTATQVDFAQLVNLSEVISAQQVPAGKYVSASITLDYGTGTTADPNAIIVVDNGAGGVTVPAANITNGSGAALVAPNNQVTLTLQLPSGKPLVITPGTVANLALDFDLAASNTVTPAAPTSTTPAANVMVMVNAVLSASLVPDTSKQIRVRGPLVSVNNMGTGSSYTVNVRPFFNNSGTQGQVVVNTTATTNFTINGAASMGSAGLTALAALPAGTLTAAYGTYDVTAQTFTAATVYAGTSIPGAGLDSVEGTVIARNGDVLTISHGIGCSRDDDDDGPWFARQIAVTVGASTLVTEDGQSGSFGPQDISVGQHALLFGKFGTDSSGNKTLDATAGSARLMITPLWGQYTSQAAGVVTLMLQSLDGNPAPVFNFAGTGTSSAQDATAAAYTVNVPSSLQLPTTNAGSPVRFLGFVEPFGMAPPDFAATTLVSYANTAAQLQVLWAPPGLTAPFVAPLSATNVVISQANLQSAWFQSVRVGPQRFKPDAVSAGLTLVPNTTATMTQFAIGHAKSRKIDGYDNFGDLITALNTDLNGMTALLGVFARGPYDSTSGILSVNSVIFVLSD
ncbi:MAG TPA: DUF4382 domain-containing protein [Steroidobacteraceae bacterium]